MKFGRAYTVYVRTEGQRLLPECPYVEFKRLKKLLKKCPHATAPGAYVSSPVLQIYTNCDTLENSNNESRGSTNALENEQSFSSCPVCDEEFFSDLDKAVSAVSTCFNARAKELLRLHLSSGIRKYLVRLRSKIQGDRSTMIRIGNTLVGYACMNALAIRKILKKYDKVHGSANGRAFKSHLQVKRVELLQSPLLIELGALSVNLMDLKLPYGLAQLRELGYTTCNFDNNKHTISCVLRDVLRLDFDLTCPICLDIVFDPVALGCGHIFCTSCACSAASVSKFQGTKVAKRSSKCPLCRQAEVYCHAVQLKELSTLISMRCREYYAERYMVERKQCARESKIYWDKEILSMVVFLFDQSADLNLADS